MKRTDLNRSLKDFSFQIFYIDEPSEIENISKPNYDYVIYVKCFPKWNMTESQLKDSIEKKPNPSIGVYGKSYEQI